jgi:hypothetical protein
LLPFAHGHVPVQPSDMPARLPSVGHVGAHSQRPSTQRPFAPQLLPPQSHVFTQVPLLHTLPAAHVTPEHGSGRHFPAAQTCLAGQATPAHALGAAHVRSHA